MSHHRRRSGSITTESDTFDPYSASSIIDARSLPAVSYFEAYRPIRSISLLPFEDLRSYHPLATVRPVRTVGGNPIQPLRVRAPKPSRGVGLVVPRSMSPHVQFAVPGKTIVCLRRRRRREVIFANQKAGRGARRRRRRRNYWSDVSC